jgi:hypothetical protein
MVTGFQFQMLKSKYQRNAKVQSLKLFEIWTLVFWGDLGFDV